MISLDENYQEVINLSFVLPVLHLNTLKTEKMLQFDTKRILDVRGRTAIPAREVKIYVCFNNIFFCNVVSISKHVNSRKVGLTMKKEEKKENERNLNEPKITRHVVFIPVLSFKLND